MSKPTTDRLPPHSIEAERGALGCLLLAPVECWSECGGTLAPEAFYDLRHRMIYEAIGADLTANGLADLITLQHRLRNANQLEAVGGMAYLSALPDATPSAANLSYYLAILREKYALRRMLRVCVDFTSRVYSYTGELRDMLNDIERDVIVVNTTTTPEQSHGGAACARKLIDDLDRRVARQGKLTGIATGFYDLDRATDGLQFGEQFIVASRPSVGKTALGLCLVNRACLIDHVPTLFVSLEMGTEALLRRLTAIQAGVSMRSLRRGLFVNEDMPKITAFSARIKTAPLHILDCVVGATDTQVCAAIRRHARQHGVKLVVVDYLQKIQPSAKHEKRTYEVAGVSGALKAVANSTGVALVTLAQLNREPDKNKGALPRLCDLADSAQIERDADVVALLHRDKSESAKPAMLIIAKQRDGQLDTIPLTFDGDHCRFLNHDHDPGI